MCSCNRATRLRALLRLAEPFCLRLNRFCKNFKRSRFLFKFFGIVKRASVRTYGKRFDAQIYTQSRTTLYGHCRKLLDGCVNQHRCKIFARRCHTNCDGLYRTFELAVRYGRNIFRLGYRNGTLSEVHAAMLRALETLLAFPVLEFRETYRMSVTEKFL